MSDPLSTEIAVAVTSSAATALAEGGCKALIHLIAALRERFRRRPAERGVLEIALDNPHDPEARRALVQLLDEHAHNDPGFALQMRELWTQAAAELDAAKGSTTNIVHGAVGGSAVQARDVYGGIMLGEARHSPRDRRGR